VHGGSVRFDGKREMREIEIKPPLERNGTIVPDTENGANMYFPLSDLVIVVMPTYPQARSREAGQLLS
jgi:hypothetical protein